MECTFFLECPFWWNVHWNTQQFIWNVLFVYLGMYILFGKYFLVECVLKWKFYVELSFCFFERMYILSKITKRTFHIERSK